MQKVVYDYSKLLGRMREMKITQRALARKIGVSETTLNWSLLNKRPWRQDEITAICQCLYLPATEISQYFFCE